MLRQNEIDKGLVVDLGCGSGLWARELFIAGHDVLGIDISPAMIEIARDRVPRGKFRVASLLKAELPRCVAVTSLGECLSYLFDESNNMRELRRLFRRVYDALEFGGVFIFDVAEPGRGKGPRQKHFEEPDWAILMEIDEDERSNQLTRGITLFRKIGDVYRRDREVHRLQLYKRSDIARELRRVGFRVHTLGAYGDQAMIKGCVGFLARKPKPLIFRRN